MSDMMNDTDFSTPFVSDGSSPMAALGGYTPPQPTPAPAPAASPNPAPAPDASQLTGASSPAASLPQMQPGAPTAKSPSKWERILTGALVGLAGGAGAKNFGQGLSGGARATLDYTQQQTENAQRQQQLDQQKAVQDSQIKFQTAQAANLAADTALRDARLHNLPQEVQDSHNAAALSQLKDMREMGLTPTLVVDNNKGGAEATAGLQQLTNSHGGVPPMFTVNVGNQIVGFDLNQLSAAPQALQQVNSIRALTGQPAIDAQTWAQTPQQVKVQQTNNAFNFFTPEASEQSLLQYKNYLNTAKAQPDSPTKDAAVQKLQTVVGNMQTALDATAARSDKQAADKIKAETPAMVSRAADIATATTKAKLAASNATGRNDDGSWNPNSIPVGLVEGTVDPSQLSKRSNDYNAKLEAANAYSMQKYGKPFDMAKAQSDYRYSTNVQTQNTLKLIDGMIQPGGAIEIAQKAAKQLPALDSSLVNKVFNATATQFGSSEATNFHTAMLGLADEYSKVMGGGVSSDTGRQQALDILKSSYSRGQFDGAVSVMQRDIAARKNALVGDNRYLLRQYGAAPQTQAAGSPPAGATMKVKGSDGLMHWSDGKSDLGVAQ